MELKRIDLAKSHLYDFCYSPVTQILVKALQNIKENTHNDIASLPLTQMSPDSLGIVLAQLEARNKVLTLVQTAADLDNIEFSFLNDYINWVD